MKEQPGGSEILSEYHPSKGGLQLKITIHMTEQNSADNVPLPFTEQSFTSSIELPPAKLTLRDAIVSAQEMLQFPILPRRKILGEWLREGDLGYLYAARGHGKTWLTMMILNAISHGRALGLWSSGVEASKAFYFDAEMNAADVKERARLLGINSNTFAWLQNEIIADKLKRRLNITDPTDQADISELLEDGSVFVIDNLSTAASGMAENDNDAFDLIKGWLLDLRSRAITVIIVHHAGRNGEMRGASRREDMAHWIISLKDDTEDGQPKAWITEFKKCRNCQANEAPPLRWTISTKDEAFTHTCVLHTGKEAMLAMIEQGVHTAKELSEELQVSTGCISKWAKKLESTKRIEIRGRKYYPVR